jgi:hypothetical protein
MIKSVLRKSPDIYPLTDIRVIDGDTIEARVLLPFETSIIKRVRLKGWWADELNGRWAIDGNRANQRLEGWLEGKAVWLHSPSCRLDRYGRIVGHLMHGEQIITGDVVLKELQLSESVHKARSDTNKAAKAPQRPESGQCHVPHDPVGGDGPM